jgi:hypothetical protein
VGGREKDNIEIHFIVYEDGTMKHTEVCWIAADGERKGRVIEGVNLIKAHYILRWNIMVKRFVTINIHLQMEEQECTIGGRWMDRLKEGEYSWCTLDTCM